MESNETNYVNDEINLLKDRLRAILHYRNHYVKPQEDSGTFGFVFVYWFLSFIVIGAIFGQILILSIFLIFVNTLFSIFLFVYYSKKRENIEYEFNEGKYSLIEARKIETDINVIIFNQEKDTYLKTIRQFVHEMEIKLNFSFPDKYFDLISIETDDVNKVNIPLSAFVIDKKFVFSHGVIKDLVKLNRFYSEENLRALCAHGNDINFLIDLATKSLEVIEFDNIYYWKIEGEIIRETHISGGGSSGGGISVTGALLGGILAGPAGMLLGGKKDIEISPIYTTINQVDQREIEFIYKKNSENMKMVFPISNNQSFKLMLPLKEFEIVKSNQDKFISSTIEEKKDNDVESKLKNLHSLFEKNLITKLEYEKKRKELIDSI